MTASDAQTAAGRALNDLADEVAAAADLDGSARRNVEFDLEFDDAASAICDALLSTRTALPADLLKRIQEGVSAGWYDGSTRDLVLHALCRQEGRHGA